MLISILKNKKQCKNCINEKKKSHLVYIQFSAGYSENNLKANIFATLLEIPLHLCSSKVKGGLVLYSLKSYFFHVAFTCYVL